VKTDDMSLACYLWFRGHAIEESQWNGGRCSWTFAATAEEDTKLFEHGQARVDPNAYYVASAEFRKQTYRSRG